MAIIAWTEDSYINLYDYASKKDLTSNFTQIKKLYDLLEINIDYNTKSNNYLLKNQERIEYFKKIGWKKPRNKFIVYLIYYLKKILGY